MIAMTTVSMAFTAFAPAQVAVLPGEHVRFDNTSVRGHTVTADDGSFDSGLVPPGGEVDRTFDTPQLFAFHCRLHAGMRGAVDVRAILLDPPSGPAAPGRPFPLSGRTSLPAGHELVVQADAGQGFTDVAHTTAGDDGTFSARVAQPQSATYRVVSGDAASQARALVVLDRQVTTTVVRRRGRDVLRVAVTPASPGGDVVLQLRIPERFGWWPVQRTRLDAASRATFVLRTHRRLPARVRLTLPDGATPLADGRVMHVGPVRRMSH